VSTRLPDALPACGDICIYKLDISDVVYCLGTWLDSDNGMVNGKRQVESNVTRIARAIKPESDDGIQQIAYYHNGVGAQGGLVDRVVMGKCSCFFFLSHINNPIFNIHEPLPLT
jgi:hypothetical protein